MKKNKEVPPTQEEMYTAQRLLQLVQEKRTSVGLRMLLPTSLGGRWENWVRLAKKLLEDATTPEAWIEEFCNLDEFKGIKTLTDTRSMLNLAYKAAETPSAKRKRFAPIQYDIYASFEKPGMTRNQALDAYVSYISRAIHARLVRLGPMGSEAYNTALIEHVHIGHVVIRCILSNGNDAVLAALLEEAQAKLQEDKELAAAVWRLPIKEHAKRLLTQLSGPPAT